MSSKELEAGLEEAKEFDNETADNLGSRGIGISPVP